MHEITKEWNNLIIKVPLFAERCNPYNDNFKEKMDSIVWVIDWDRIGFAHYIDMSYKDKADQVSSLFYEYDRWREDFIRLCNKLWITIEESLTCDECWEVIYGCFTFKNWKNICDNCTND